MLSNIKAQSIPFIIFSERINIIDTNATLTRSMIEL